MATHACLSGSLSCSGCIPCAPCFNRQLEDVLTRAVHAAGAALENARPMFGGAPHDWQRLHAEFAHAFFRGHDEGWQALQSRLESDPMLQRLDLDRLTLKDETRAAGRIVESGSEEVAQVLANITESMKVDAAGPTAAELDQFARQIEQARAAEVSTFAEFVAPLKPALTEPEVEEEIETVADRGPMRTTEELNADRAEEDEPGDDEILIAPKPAVRPPPTPPTLNGALEEETSEDRDLRRIPNLVTRAFDVSDIASAGVPVGGPVGEVLDSALEAGPVEISDVRDQDANKNGAGGQPLIHGDIE